MSSIRRGKSPPAPHLKNRLPPLPGAQPLRPRKNIGYYHYSPAAEEWTLGSLENLPALKKQ